MSEVYAVKSGDWSDTTVWNTGSLPAPGDVVHANGFSVQLDVDVECDRLTTAAGDTAVAGGGFYIAADITIAADIEAGDSKCLNNGSVFTTVVSGNVSGGSANARGMYITGNGDVSVAGDITGGVGDSARGLNIQGDGDVSITGDITGGVGAYAHGLNIQGSGYVSVTGDITGGVNDSTFGLYIQGDGDVSVTGDITGGVGSSANGLYIQGNGNILGDGNVDIQGSVSGGTGAAGIYNTGFNRLITILGKVFTNTTNPGVSNINGQVVLSQMEIKGSGYVPISGFGFHFTDDVVIEAYNQDAEQMLLTSQGIPDGIVVIPENVEYCRVYSFLRMPGDTKPSVEQVAGRVQLKILTEPTENGVSMYRGHVQANYNSDNGLLFWDVPRGAKVEVRGREFFPTSISFIVPDDVNFDFGDLVA